MDLIKAFKDYLEWPVLDPKEVDETLRYLKTTDPLLEKEDWLQFCSPYGSDPEDFDKEIISQDVVKDFPLFAEVARLAFFLSYNSYARFKGKNYSSEMPAMSRTLSALPDLMWGILELKHKNAWKDQSIRVTSDGKVKLLGVKKDGFDHLLDELICKLDVMGKTPGQDLKDLKDKQTATKKSEKPH